MSASVTFNQDLRADPIDSLPVDQNIPSPSEVQILDTLFQKKHGVVQQLLFGTKDILLIGFIFLLFSLPQVDDLIKKFVSVANSSQYILLLVKTLLFMGAYFIVKNLYLVRKN